MDGANRVLLQVRKRQALFPVAALPELGCLWQGQDPMAPAAVSVMRVTDFFLFIEQHLLFLLFIKMVATVALQDPEAVPQLLRGSSFGAECGVPFATQGGFPPRNCRSQNACGVRRLRRLHSQLHGDGINHPASPMQKLGLSPRIHLHLSLLLLQLLHPLPLLLPPTSASNHWPWTHWIDPIFPLQLLQIFFRVLVILCHNIFPPYCHVHRDCLLLGYCLCQLVCDFLLTATS